MLSSVFTEEVGHALDARLNTSDTTGDEGELFRKLVAGEAPTTAERLRVLSDNDHGTVTVDGKRVDVEFFLIKIPNPFKIIKDEIIEPALDFAKDEIIEPRNENIVKPFKNHIGNPLIDFGESVFDIGVDLIKFPFEVGQTLLEGNKEVIQSFICK